MATFVANRAVNMSSSNGLGVLDTQVGLEQLMSASQTGEQQVWAVGAAGYLEIDLTVISNFTATGGTFAADFTKLELQDGPTLGDTPKWTLTNLPLDVTGSFSFNGDFSVITVTADVPGMGGVQASVQLEPLEVLSLSDTLSSGDYDNFAQYLLRQGDSITGSSGKDTLLGFGGNDKINGGGGADVIDGGVGKDVINGGAGNDKITWGAGDKVNGGAGSADVLKLGVDLNLVPLSKKVLGIEIIDMRGGGNDNDRLTLNATDVLEMPGKKIRILGDTNDIVDISGSNGTRTTVGGFYQYKVGGATLLIEQDVNVI
jgi:hypothetical protein